MPKSYRDLDVYKMSFELFIKTHQISLKLPKYELYELGSQIRRSADSVNSNIVEGYGRKRYKLDFIKFLTYSIASNDETLNHFLKINRLYPHLTEEVGPIIEEYNHLGKKLNLFIKYVSKNWKT